MAGESYNQIQINRAALCHNYRLLQKRAGSQTRLLAMVKADAYGHGMIESAKTFADVGCKDFGVAEIGEGVQLRASDIQGNIFIFLGFDSSDVALFFDYGLTPVLYDMESAKVLSREAVKQNKEITVHLKVDCGMTRLGILPDEVEQFLTQLKQLPGIVCAGIASHFPRADEQDSSHTPEQFLYFEQLSASADKIQKHSLIKHTANSGGILYFPQTCCDMVRAGIALYGYYPDGIAGVGTEAGEKLQPAMSFTTRVLQVKTVSAGVGVSYGHTYTTDGKTRIAVLPVGYEDGLSRSLSNTGEVLIHGKRAAIIGRICMNLCMVDVSHIKGVQPGDKVVVLGSQFDETISGDEIAGWMDSISYEVLCLFGNNNQRKHIE
ncbi:MAG: alanine racemase [Thermodesulfobacteriota bacterium]|nr:alanine racemase [Thermodesulfobacteriota bacterium]